MKDFSQPPLSGRVQEILSEILYLPYTLFYMAFTAIVLRMPEERALAFGRAIIVPLFFNQRARILRNMKIVLGSERENDLPEYRSDHLRHISDMIVELTRLPRENLGELSGRVRIDGEENLRAALAQGKGVLLVGTHIGNWWYGRARLAASGYRISYAANRIPMRTFERQLGKVRKTFGIDAIYVGEGGTRTAQELFARNRIFSVQCDISVRGRELGSQWLPFGSGFMLVDLGPARLAIRNKIPVIRASMSGKARAGYTLTLYPSIVAEEAASPRELTEKWLSELWDELSRGPGEWWNWGGAKIR